MTSNGVNRYGTAAEGSGSSETMYDSVLIPTDGSDDMTAVVDQAIDLAELCEAELHVLHVVDERAYFAVPEDARDRVRDTLEEDALAFTKSVSERAIAAELDVHREVRWGDPATAILAYAVEHEVGVIVMGTHGRTGYERYLLGSVAEKVVRVAPMPVLAIAVGDTDRQREEVLSVFVPDKKEDETTIVDDPP